jgi:protein-disulfide isomerase
MKVKFERTRTQGRDLVLIEPDGTVFTAFMKTGYLSAATRTRFASGHAAATGAFSISSGANQQGDGGTANHGLVFISEVDGQEKIALIERFATEADARHGLSLVQAAVRRYVVGQRRKQAWRTILRYAGVPLLTLVVAMSAVRFLDSHNASYEALNALVSAAQANPGAQVGLTSASQAAASADPGVNLAKMGAIGASPFPLQPVQPPAAVMQPDAPASAAAVANASAQPASPAPDVASAMTSIHFGLDNQPPKRTLYVYSDPNCPACKQFESHIDDLAKDFSIYVFPVAYQDGSAKVAAQILCAADRKQKWSDTMTHVKAGEPVTGNECARAYGGIKANMQAFDSLGFNSTPRIVSGTGFVYAAGVNANTIRIQSAAQ